MQYCKLGNTGLDVSILSIGAMRLPKDYDESTALLRAAIDAGCNYIDTSRGYGESELKLAQALKDGYRDKVILSTKCSPWIYEEDGYTSSADDTRRKIDESMTRLDVDRLDFYQVWNVCSAETYAQAIAPGGMVDAIRKAIDEGIVDHIGVTTHAPESVIIEMIDSGIFESITLSYHLLSRKKEEMIERAASRNVGVVVMNPMAGGALGYPSQKISSFLDGSILSSQEIALKYVFGHPHVSCAISGFSKMSDVVENVAIAESPPLTHEERQTLAQRAEDLDAEGMKFCTQCGYCMPCEQGVNIKGIFNLMNRARLFDLDEWARQRYTAMKAEKRADRCTRCGECEEKCTNDLAIGDELAKAHDHLT
jgi:uncharacterized protein